MSLCQENNTVLTVTFDIWGVLSSIIVSFIGAYVAVHIAAALGKHNDKHAVLYRFLFAVAVAMIAIWYMHFRGMSSLTFQCPGETSVHIPQSFEILTTLASLIVAIIFTFLGVSIAARDTFFKSDKEQAVKTLSSMVNFKELVGSNSARRVRFAAIFGQPQYFIMGGIVTGLGVAAMHYIGMIAINHAGFRIEWSTGLVIFSCFLAMTVASVGFWIVFRLLRWRPHLEWLRIVSALVIAIAVCSMHYTGQFAATYISDSSQPMEASIFHIADSDLQDFAGVLCCAVLVVILVVVLIYEDALDKQRNIEVSQDLKYFLVNEVLTAGTLAEAQFKVEQLLGSRFGNTTLSTSKSLKNSRLSASSEETETKKPQKQDKSKIVPI